MSRIWRIRNIKGDYSSILDDGQDRWLVVIEQMATGDEFVLRDSQDIRRIGTFLGKLHVESLHKAIRFGHGTTWSLFGGNVTEESGDYDENESCFRSALEYFEQGGCSEIELRKIRELYTERRSRVCSVWATLPQASIQGDLCPYNMTRGTDDEIGGVFDLNIAGDEVLIGELSALLAYYARYAPTGVSPTEAMRIFFQAYLEQRSLQSDEYKVMKTLLQFLIPFRFDRVAELKRKIETEGTPAAHRLAQETITLLEQNYIDLLNISIPY